MHFPGQSKVCLFSTQGQVTLRKLYYMAEIQTLLKFYACPRKLQWEKSCDQNLRSYPLDKVKHGLFQPLRASDSKTNTNMAELRTCPSLDACKFKGVILRTKSNMGYFSTQGQVIRKRTVQYGRNSNLSEFLMLDSV